MAHARELATHIAYALLDPGSLVRRARRRQTLQVDGRVPLTRDGFVELDDDLAHVGLLISDAADGIDRRRSGIDVLATHGMRDAFLDEQAAGPALRSEGEEFRIRTVHRNAEPQGQIALELRSVIGHQMGALAVHDEGADALDQMRAFKQLDGERPRAAVLRRDEEKARSSVARNHAREQSQVVIHRAWQDGLRGYIDQPGAGLAQEQQEKKESLLVRLHRRALDVNLCRDRWNNDDGLLLLIEGTD